MKSRKFSKNATKLNKRLVNEDMRLLQKMTSGASVYKSFKAAYSRKPKHYKTIFSY